MGNEDANKWNKEWRHAKTQQHRELESEALDDPELPDAQRLALKDAEGRGTQSYTNGIADEE
eukprot:3029611-Amphidinium_carterae.1